MAKFIPYDYNQSSMVVINFNDDIQTGTFEHAVHHLEFNKNLTRVTLQGLKKINGQRKLFCLLQNIEKLEIYGKLAA
jgi:hypothetical protein